MGQSTEEETKQNLWKTAFKKFEGDGLPRLQIFQRLSSKNFTWSIFQYFVLNEEVRLTIKVPFKSTLLLVNIITK